MTISFPVLGKFSSIISSIFSWPFFLSSSSETHDSNVGAFNRVMFKGIIDKYDPLAIYFIVLGSSLYTLSVFLV